MVSTNRDQNANARSVIHGTRTPSEQGEVVGHAGTDGTTVPTAPRTAAAASTNSRDRPAVRASTNENEIQQHRGSVRERRATVTNTEPSDATKRRKTMTTAEMNSPCCSCSRHASCSTSTSTARVNSIGCECVTAGRKCINCACYSTICRNRRTNASALNRVGTLANFFQPVTASNATAPPPSETPPPVLAGTGATALTTPLLPPESPQRAVEAAGVEAAAPDPTIAAPADAEAPEAKYVCPGTTLQRFHGNFKSFCLKLHFGEIPTRLGTYPASWQIWSPNW